MLRSALAVVAGYLFLTVLSRSASYVLAFAFPPIATGAGTVAVPTSLYVATTVAGGLAGIAGGHACARLARRAEMAHVAALAGILAAMGLALAARPPAGISPGFALAEVAVGVAGVLVGGMLRSFARER